MEKFQEIDFKKVGACIRNARKALSLTQERAAERANISSQFWSLIESGRERGSVITYRRIAAVIGLTLDDIFYDDATNLRLHKAFSKEGILADCTTYERAIIGETMLALKGTLERNRRV